jgi:hypothetical protein
MDGGDRLVFIDIAGVVSVVAEYYCQQFQNTNFAL